MLGNVQTVFPDDIDFTSEGEISSPLSDLYHQIALETRRDYANYIGSLFSKEKNKLDWWLEAAASRNPVFSQVHHHLISLLTLRRILQTGKKPSKIIVDSPMMVKAVQSLCIENGVSVSVVGPSAASRFLKSIRRSISPYRSMLRIFCEWLVVRIATPANQRGSLNNTRLILIDTFAIPGYVEMDRYYPGLYKQAGSEQQSIRFVPQFFNLSLADHFVAANQLSRKKERYLFKERFLSIWDLVWCFGHLFRIKSTLPTDTRFLGIDLTTLICEDILSRRAFRCAVRGLINYRFARSLSREKIEVKKTIDWFENHPLDRGWNAGFNQFYSKASRAGYTGFFPAGQNFRPTNHELIAGVLPQEHLVIGEGVREDFCEFFPDCNVDTAPAFRYQNLPDIEILSCARSWVLIALPYFQKNCEEIIRIINKVAAKHTELEFVVKPHPARPLGDIRVTLTEFSENIQINEGPLTSILCNSAVMVSGSQASTILESAALGVPAIVVPDQSFASEVSIPSAVPDQLYNLCRNISEVESVLEKIFSSSASQIEALKELGAKVRANCFEPVTKRSIDKFLSA